MTSEATAHREVVERREHVNAVRHEQEDQAVRRRRLVLAVWAGALVVAIAVITGMMLSSRPTSSTAARTAPDFTLANAAGQTVHLGGYRGKNVILYFSEGAGCQACITQMGEITHNQAAFDKANIVVLPIVMNTKEQIVADMAANGVTTPFLLDDGTVSKEYGTLGKGMHAGLPGHSFVLIDAQGVQRWYGEYPSMWLAPKDLLAETTKHL
jgi:peroxiredoxin